MNLIFSEIECQAILTNGAAWGKEQEEREEVHSFLLPQDFETLSRVGWNQTWTTLRFRFHLRTYALTRDGRTDGRMHEVMN